MRCPNCGDENAYMGFSSIDCPNNTCRHFTGSGSNPATVPMPAAMPANTTPASVATIAQCWVDITATVPKKSTVLISLMAHGDPGHPNKKIEILWSLPGQNVAHICTLSGSNGYHIAGVDADGHTVYTTHWRCGLDGLKPTDNFILDARIM